MKIAVWHNLPSGGGKRALYNHVKALKEKGHYLEAWTTDMSSEDYLPLSDFIIEHRKSIKDDFDKTYRISNPLKSEQKRIEIYCNHYKECVKEIEDAQFDIVFANSCIYSYLPYISQFTKLPKIVYLGEPFRPYYEALPENIWQAPYKKLILKKIKRLYKDYLINYSRRLRVLQEIESAKRYDTILVNSLFSRESVLRAYGVDSTVCYLGIDANYFIHNNVNKKNYVVGLGSISFNKSVHKAIEIIGAIPREVRPVLKWVANSINQRYFDEMILLAKKLDVDFQPFIKIEDIELIEIISNAAVMLYTSRLEPFGLAPLESNACGTYVVAIAEGGVRESISNGKNGSLINSYKLIEFVNEIVPFIADVNYALKKGLEARNYVIENWNENMMAKNICSEIENLVLSNKNDKK
jgi:glycosyltransferase involved in cell wall biosynthesis